LEDADLAGIEEVGTAARLALLEDGLPQRARDHFHLFGKPRERLTLQEGKDRVLLQRGRQLLGEVGGGHGRSASWVERRNVARRTRRIVPTRQRLGKPAAWATGTEAWPATRTWGLPGHLFLLSC